MTTDQQTTETTNPLNYLPWDVTPSEANMIGASLARYIRGEDIDRAFNITGVNFEGRNNPWATAARSLFFHGGSLQRMGFTLKSGIHRHAGHCIQALLISFDPPHEQKMWTVAYALWAWFDYAQPSEAQQAENEAATGPKPGLTAPDQPAKLSHGQRRRKQRPRKSRGG